MSNLIDIQTQIEKLQKQAADIRSREFDKTVQDIVARMQAFGITIKDIQAATARGTKAPKGRAKPRAAAKAPADKARKSGAAATVAPKYRGPNGEVWSGRGLTPKWLAALIGEGKQKEQFAIQP